MRTAAIFTLRALVSTNNTIVSPTNRRASPLSRAFASANRRMEVEMVGHHQLRATRAPTTNAQSATTVGHSTRLIQRAVDLVSKVAICIFSKL